MLSILGTLKESALIAADILNAIPTPGYNYPSRKGKKKIYSSYLKDAPSREVKRKEQQKFYNLLYYLRKNDFIREERKDRSMFFSLTSKGWAKISELENRSKIQLPKIEYNLKTHNDFAVIAFDIPEKMRKKRDWLRYALKTMNFKNIQKSVWIGKGKIPKEFLDDLKNLQIISCVEIFVISSKGRSESL